MAGMFSSDPDWSRILSPASLDGQRSPQQKPQPAPRADRRRLTGLMERVAVNQLTTLRLSFDQDLIEYTRAKVPGIGVSWRKLSAFGVQRGIRAVRRCGLPVSSLGWVGGFTGWNGFSLDDAIGEARRAIRVAAQLRAPTVVVVTGPQAGHINSHARRLVTAALRELAPIAQRYGVVLALKPMCSLFRSNWTFINQLADAADTVDRVDHSHVRLAYGCYHLWHEPDAQEQLRQVCPLICHVQLADWKQTSDQNDQLIPGEGCIPFQELLETLDAGGYTGWMELEVWSRDLWKCDAAALIQRCLAGLADLSGSVGPYGRA